MNNLANLIFPILILVVIVILLIKRMKGRNIYKTNFIKRWNIYKYLSPENRVSFWSFTSNVILIIITFWLGLSMQHLVNNSVQAESAKLARYQIVDRFYPMYQELFDSCSNVMFKECWRAVGAPDDNDGIAVLDSFISNEKNWEVIDYTARKMLEISHRMVPYVDENVRDTLKRNNSLLFAGCQIIEMLNDTIILDFDSFKRKLTDGYLEASVSGIVLPQRNLSDLTCNSFELYKLVMESRSQAYDSNMKKLIIRFYMLPILGNLDFINKELSPKPEGDPGQKSIRLLCISLLIGGALYLIILIVFFDRNSLEPNPRMSQSDLERIRQELTSHRQLEDSFNRQTEAIRNYQQEIKSLRVQIQGLESANQSLSEEIQHLKEIEKECES